MKFLTAILMVLITVTAFGAGDEAGHYAMVMANGSAIRISEYRIDLEHQTVTYKSPQSGLVATFPLDRMIRIVAIDPACKSIPGDAPVMYANATSLEKTPDDGGIPVIFKVTTQVVSGGNGSNRPAARPGSQSFSSRGSRGSGSSSAGRSNSRSARSFGSSRSKSPSSSSSHSSSSFHGSSSSSGADDFFSALFGGR